MAIALVVLGTTICQVSAQENPPSERELTVLDRWFQWQNAPSFLVEQFNREAFGHLSKRKKAIRQLETRDDWLRRQKEVEVRLNDLLGPFPERSPLNPKTTGVLHKDGFRVEKIVFESRPQFYVTGCLFIPSGLQGRAPAVLNPIGHTDVAFRAESYQQLILNLVKKGFVVFAFDPLSQGERLQYYDPEKGESTVGRATSEHSYFGRQCFLNGIPSARYFAWDGIRAIDYLLSRDEVDPDRIAVTGISGGGTQTAYIAALDDRVKVAAPACYITSFRRLLQSIGPQDAEQNILRALPSGLDHADFIEIRAPKPTLIIATTRDFFSIQGTRETYREAKAAFAALGAGENLRLAEDDYTHGYTRKTRETLYAFLQEHLSMPGDPTDEPIEPLTPDELTVTSTGQIVPSLDSRRVYDFNKEDAERQLARLAEERQEVHAHLRRVKTEAANIAGYRAPEDRIRKVFAGGISQPDYRIEKYVLASEGRCIIPVWIFTPETPGPHPSVIYLSPEGKSFEGPQRDFIKALLERGFIVATPDLSGLGEVGESVSGIKAQFTAALIGRSIPGFHAGEINRIAKFLEDRDRVTSIAAVADSHLCPALLHAAAFDSGLDRIVLIRPLVSYGAVATSLFYEAPGWTHVQGALRAYDLPDLAACVAPRPLLILSPTGPLEKPIPEGHAGRSYEIVNRAYTSQQVRDNFRLLAGVETEEDIRIRVLDWLKETDTY